MISYWNEVMRAIAPAKHIKQIEDPEEKIQVYKHWRIRVFYSMYIGYAFYYVTRKSLSFLFPLVSREFGLSYSDIGIFTTVMTASYGISKFANGVLADRANPRMIMPIGLLITALCALGIGFSHSITFFLLLWGINGWFQGFGWPACARLLTHWYDKRERGTLWGVWNTSHNVGGALTPIVISFLAAAYGWRFAMIVPACAAGLIAIFLYNRLCDTPQSKGLPPIEKYRGLHEVDHSVHEEGSASDVNESPERELSAKERLFDYVLKNPSLWLLSIAYFFLYIVRTAVNDWSAVYLVDHRGYSMICAGQVCSWFEIGGFLGGLSAGLLSDRIFKGQRGPVNVLFMLASALSILPWFFEGTPAPLTDSMIMFFLGFFLFGPQMLIGVAAAELSHKKSAASATGFISFFANLGGMCAGWPLGKLIEHSGWNNYFYVMFLCCSCCFLVLMPLWSKKSRAD